MLATLQLRGYTASPDCGVNLDVSECAPPHFFQCGVCYHTFSSEAPQRRPQCRCDRTCPAPRPTYKPPRPMYFFAGIEAADFEQPSAAHTPHGCATEEPECDAWVLKFRGGYCHPYRNDQGMSINWHGALNPC